MKKQLTYKEWCKTAETISTIGVKDYIHDHYIIRDNVRITEIIYLPRNIFKKSTSITYVDLIFSKENNNVIELMLKHGGEFFDNGYIAYGYFSPQFKESKTIKSIESAYNFVMALSDSDISEPIKTKDNYWKI